jgi:hypothetical protein
MNVAGAAYLIGQLFLIEISYVFRLNYLYIEIHGESEACVMAFL